MRPWETPVPIPNTMVKPWTADDTWLVTAWESRWLPFILKTNVYDIDGQATVQNMAQMGATAVEAV